MAAISVTQNGFHKQARVKLSADSRDAHKVISYQRPAARQKMASVAVGRSQHSVACSSCLTWLHLGPATKQLQQ